MIKVTKGRYFTFQKLTIALALQDIDSFIVNIAICLFYVGTVVQWLAPSPHNKMDGCFMQ